MARAEPIPLKMVGGNKFGRYPKISREETFNMIISDGSLVDYAGYMESLRLSNGGEGRRLFGSVKNNIMIAVVGGSVYRVDSALSHNWIGSLETTTGSAWVVENNANQIAISDGSGYYVYDVLTGDFELVDVGFKVGFISFQNGRIMAKGDGNTWRLSDVGNAKSFPIINEGLLQTKPDQTQAVFPVPGKGNLAFVAGKSVIEAWTDVGGTLFPYQKNSTFNIDYGVINPASIAIMENVVCFVGASAEGGAVLFASSGGNLERLSTDGIDFRLSRLDFASECSSFLFKQDGHLIWQITWPKDNWSIIYDFASKEFFTVTDPDLNYHIARDVVFFRGKYYFVSFRDGSIYEFGTQFTTLNGEEMPRIRITPPSRKASQNYWRIRSVSFTAENGQWNHEDNMAIDLSLSADGGENFGNYARYQMNPTGIRRSKIIWYNCGAVNDVTFQFRFHGLGRYVVFDGVIEEN